MQSPPLPYLMVHKRYSTSRTLSPFIELYDDLVEFLPDDVFGFVRYGVVRFQAIDSRLKKRCRLMGRVVVSRMLGFFVPCHLAVLSGSKCNKRVVVR